LGSGSIFVEVGTMRELLDSAVQKIGGSGTLLLIEER
jgi:hypothetical protein